MIMSWLEELFLGTYSSSLTGMHLHHHVAVELWSKRLERAGGADIFLYTLLASGDTGYTSYLAGDQLQYSSAL
jgi:hypothetical protein